jgi:N-acetylmuramoyl-L-alanine amidase.
MTGLIIGGVVVPVNGRRVVNWRDDRRLRLEVPEDGRKRPPGTWIRQVILHTTKGIPGGKDRRPQEIRPGMGPATDAGARTNAWWSRDPRQSGAHLVVDHDTTIACLADLRDEITYHAGVVNERSIGIEVYQGGDAELYSDQLEAVADLVDLLTLVFGIQRQIPHRYAGPIPRLEEGGRDCVGVFGHRDCTNNRGAGDPGDAIFQVLAARGYERFDFRRGVDLTVWHDRQRATELDADGVPGPRTVARLRSLGYAGGLWSCPPASSG